MMESSELKTNIRTVVDGKQPHLYFGKYRYKFIIHQMLSGIIRYMKCSDFTSGNYKKRVFYINRKHVSFEEYCEQYNTSIEKLMKILEWREQNSHRGLFRTDHNTISVYTNEYDFIESYAKDRPLETYVIYERVGVKSINKEVLYRKKRKYNYRAYLKPSYLKESQWKDFVNDLTVYSMSPCSSLRLKTFKQTAYITYSDFIEFNDDATISILYLKYSSLIKKIYRVEGF